MRRQGVVGSIWQIISALVLFGILLAVLAQFGGDVGAAIQWVLQTMWNFVITVRDTVAGWLTFQRLFA